MADGRDPRLIPARSDIAAAHLEGLVDAPRFVDGTLMQVTSSVLPIRRSPAADGPQETQALFGEGFTVYDESDGWAWGQAALDGYVGYVDVEGLSQPFQAPTHRVSALRAYRFSEPDLKSAPYGLVSMNAKLNLGETVNGFAQDQGRGWVWLGHTVPLGDRADDPVAVAELYLGTPYFWGGRESLGLDCSALVQNAFEACGKVLPRDADLQEAYWRADQQLWDGDDQSWTDIPLSRGDLLYWPGHTAIMIDSDRMIHANATHMATTVDQVVPMCARWVEEKNLRLRRIIRP